MPPESDPSRRAVVTGLGAVMPIGNDFPTYWANLKAGVTGTRTIRSFDASQHEVRIAAEVDQIVQQSIAAAKRTRGVIRLPLGQKAKMVIAVAGLDGEILGLYRMPDATVFSIDVAVAKARNVVWYSQGGNLPPLPAGTAVTNRTISFGAQPLFPAGIDGTAPGPFFPLFVDDLARPCFHGFDPASPNRNGVVFFPGSIPLYRGDRLVGGLGVSGDGVEQDDYVSFLGAAGFLPPENLWADRHTVRGVRLPFLKFPRNPEG